MGETGSRLGQTRVPRSFGGVRTLQPECVDMHRPLLGDSPSLEPVLPGLLADAYDSALRWAADETGLDECDFPQLCPYDVECVGDPDYYAGA